MKTKTTILAATVAIALTGLASAAQSTTKSSAAQARSTGNTPPAAATDDTSMTWKVARYPFRVGHSMLRGPMVGETFTGKRTFVNEHGLFQTADQSNDSDQRNSIPQGRGQRTNR